MSTSYSYDNLQRLVGMNYPDENKKKIKFTYDGRFLEAIDDVTEEGKVKNYATSGVYDKTGHLGSMKGGNGTVRKENWNEAEGILESYSWGIAENAGDELLWNNRGSITQIKKNGTAYDYEYDGKNQINKETRASEEMNTWKYDSKGNRSESNGKSVTCYENSDLIKDDGTWKYSYDMNGNLVWKGKSGTSKTEATDNLYEGWSYNATSGEVWYYGYDNFNRLVLVKKSTAGTNGLKKVAEYTYDYRDLLVCRNADEYFEYTPEGTLIYDGRPYPNSDRDYVYANGAVWCELTGAGNIFYHHTDYLGTTEYMTDKDGTVVWQCEYEAFGKVIKKSGSKASSFKPMYTGKQMDESTGLYYFNARWYDPGQGRFITPDPARDGINWWIYCRNNPLTNVDPSGLTTLDDFAYQKRTNDSDKSVQNQRTYDHQSREYALRNQGLTDYGRAIHNNEDFFYNFMDQTFDYPNPLSQLDLDRALGFKTDRKSTESCMLAAMINAYAYLLKNGITGMDIINAIFDNSGNFNYFIGVDCNKRQGVSSPYCKGLWAFSKSIADTMNLKRDDFVESFLKRKGSSTDSVYLCPMNKEYFSFSTYWLKNVKDPDINTPLIEGITTTGWVAQHYIFTYSVNIIDSLPADRPNKPNYKRCFYYELQLMRR